MSKSQYLYNNHRIYDTLIGDIPRLPIVAILDRLYQWKGKLFMPADDKMYDAFYNPTAPSIKGITRETSADVTIFVCVICDSISAECAQCTTVSLK